MPESGKVAGGVCAGAVGAEHALVAGGGTD